VTTNIIQIPADPRPISTIAFGPTETDLAYSVGINGVSSITPYWENGEMAPVPWFAVKIGDDIIARVPAHMVFVTYQPAGGIQ
jgi:hypothetical protein